MTAATYADDLTDADLAAYLARIGHRGPTEPTLGLLGDLVAGHNRSIPFENLDPVFGVPVLDLSAAALADKLVHRRRGGYCYEHNGLLGYVLERLGYGVERFGGRVVWMHEPGAPLPARTHQVLGVTVPGTSGRQLVDVGFGGQTLTSPVELTVGVEQATRHEPYRLTEGAEGLVLEALVGGAWRALYEFTTSPQPCVDLEVGSWYVSTHPASHFVTGLTASLVADDARWNLRGRHLSVHRVGGTQKTRFDTAEQVLTALADTFGVDLTDVATPDVLVARVGQLLDA